MIGSRLWQIAGWTMLHYFWVGAALGAVALLARQSVAVGRGQRALSVCLGQSAAAERRARGNCRRGDAEHCPGCHASTHPWLPKSQAGAWRVLPETGAADRRRQRAGCLAVAPPHVSAAAPDAQASERLLAALNLAAMCLPWLWVCGAPLSFALTTAGLLGAERLRRQSRPLEDARITEMCRQLAASLSISYRVERGRSATALPPRSWWASCVR